MADGAGPLDARITPRRSVLAQIPHQIPLLFPQVMPHHPPYRRLIRPGALSEFLKRKGLTQIDAHQKTRVDRKTLLKIQRGEEVKQETLQQVATALQVPLDYFRTESTTEVATDSLASDTSGPSILLRKVSAERLADMLKDAERINWHLNVQIIDADARNLLLELEDAVSALHQYLRPKFLDEEECRSLRSQLQGLEKVEDVANRLQRLSHQHVSVLGAEYLFWDHSRTEDAEGFSVTEYTSVRNVVLSIEGRGTESKRVPVVTGTEPPTTSPHDMAQVKVNGMFLLTDEEVQELIDMEGPDAF